MPAVRHAPLTYGGVPGPASATLVQMDSVDPVSAEISKTLMKAKTKSGLTYQEIADAAGLSARSVIRYLQGERSPQVRELWPLAQALGLDPSEVILEAEARLRGK